MRVVLILILLVACGYLGGMGLFQHLRRRALMRLANERALAFWRADPLEIPRRYADCELMRSGHGAYAENVLVGRVAGWMMRAFDCHFEAGHGPHRQRHRLTVVAADLPFEAAPAVAWRGEPAAGMVPLLCRPAVLDGGWRGAGDLEWARRIAEAWPKGDTAELSVQAGGGSLLAASGGLLSARQLAGRLESVAAMLGTLHAALNRPPACDTRPGQDG